MVNLGCVDIFLEVLILSFHLAFPREGQLQQLFRMLAYLKRNHNSNMVFDPSDPVIYESHLDRKDWTASEFGFSLDEKMPTNMTQPRGMDFIMRAYVDADQNGDSITRRSCTGFLVYLNFAPM